SLLSGTTCVATPSVTRSAVRGSISAVKAKRAALSEEQKTEARRLFDCGSTRRELMKMYGVSESTIRRALDDMNSDQLRCRVLARSLLIIPERRPHELRPVLRAVEPHSYMIAGLIRSHGEYGAANLATRRRVIIQVEHVYPPENVGYRLLIAAQSASLNHSTIPDASSGLAVAIDLRNRDGARLLGYPPFVGTELARLRITPCRAREIITESTRASSAISSGVVAIENGMKSSSSPTTIAQSN